MITKADSGNDISIKPLMIRLFASAADPYLAADSVAGIRAGKPAAVGESSAILLHPPLHFINCFNRDAKGGAITLTVSPTTRQDGVVHPRE